MADIIQKTDSLNDGRVKLNKAITQAEQAGFDAGKAKIDADKAIALAKSTQTQLDTVIVDGDSSVEAAQARVDETGKVHPTLKARVDDGIAKVTSLINESGNEAAQARTDETGKTHPTLKARVDTGITKVNTLIGDTTDEIEQARVDEYGTVHPNLKDRFKALEVALESTSGTNIKNLGAVGNGTKSDSQAFQRAFDVAKNKGSVTIVVPPGKYRMTEELKIYKGTKIVFSPNAELIRDHAGYMLMNGNRSTESDPSNFTLYNGNGNITIIGGIWNANGVAQPSKASIFHLGHAENIFIEYATLKDCANSHHIEFNACRNVHVSHCSFLGWVGGNDTFNEVIQLDLPFTASPTIGANDRTPCKDVYVSNCYFGDSGTPGSTSIGRAFGSHSSIITRAHQNINFTNNIVYNSKSFTVRAYNWEKVVISGNVFVKCGAGVNWRTAMTGPNTNDPNGNPSQSEVMESGVISNNVFHGGLTTGRAIEIYGESGTPGEPWGIIVSGNTITGDSDSSSGILVSDSIHVVVTGNRIKDRNIGIELRNSSRVTATSNVLTGLGGDGIRVTGCNYTNVSNNTITLASINGILVSGCDTFIINGNIISGPNRIGTPGSTNRHISVISGATRGSITGNACRSYGAATSTHALYVTNACTDIVTSGNNARGFTWYNGATGGTVDAYGNMT